MIDTIVLALGIRPDCPDGGEEENAWEMSPVGDRPWLQHVLESLALQQSREVLLILHHQPQEIESYFGDGERWGVKFHYRLARDAQKPFACLRAMQLSGEILLGSALCLPPQDVRQAKTWKAASRPGLLPWMSLQASDLLAQWSNPWPECVEDAQTLPVDYFGIESTAALLQVNRAFLDGILPVLHKGREIEPGVWVERDVVMHPTAQVVAPVFLSEHCRIGAGAVVGPYAVLGRRCLVDDHCQIRNSVLQENTYLGAGLELEDMVASPSGLRLASDGELIVVNDATLLGRSQQLSFWDWQRPLARVLDFCLKPLQWLPRRSKGKPVEFVLAGGPDDPDAWRNDTIPNSSDDFKTPRQHFRRVFLPGLSAAAQGKLRLVGLTPQSHGRLSRQPRLRRRRYLELGPGLIGEALVQFGPKADEHEQELGDAYQAAHPRASYQLGLLWRYFLDVAINRPTRLG